MSLAYFNAYQNKELLLFCDKMIAVFILPFKVKLI